MKAKIEVFNTGGGITLAEAYVNWDRIAVVSTEAPEFLTIYKRTEDEAYLPEDMVMSIKETEMNDEFKGLYAEMLKALKNA
jgi:hypothetical protein